MVSPKQLEFSTLDGASHDTLSLGKSPRTPASKRAVSDDGGTEEMTKKDKKKRKIKKEKSASSVINRIWNRQDELVVLKALTGYKAERGMKSKVEWETFNPLVGDSIAAKYSKEQIMSKTRKLKKSFFDHIDKIKQGIDSHSPTFNNAEAFELAIKIWETNEDEAGQEMLKGNEEALDEDEAVENENTEVLNNESGKEVLKEQNGVANAEQLIDNGSDTEQLNDNGEDAEQLIDIGEDAAQLNDKELLLEENEVANSETLNENGVLKTTKKGTAEKATEVEIAGKASHDVDNGAKQPEKKKQNAEDEFANVQDAFETLLSHDLSDHQKRLQIEKLKKVESGVRRKLSDEWNALCTRERNLKIRKIKFSAVLAQASKEN